MGLNIYPRSYIDPDISISKGDAFTEYKVVALRSDLSPTQTLPNAAEHNHSSPQSSLQEKPVSRMDLLPFPSNSFI